jgi:hypothetical protein
VDAAKSTRTSREVDHGRRRTLLLATFLLAFLALALPQAASAAITSPSVSINADAPFTNQLHVTLNLSAVSSDGSQIYVSVNGDKPPKKIRSSWPYNLPAGPDGERTVTVEFTDSDNVPVSASDTIVLDTTAPVTGVVPADDVSWHTAPDALTFGGFTDNVSGVATFEYQIDGGGWVTTLAPTEVVVTLDPALLGDGTHTVSFRATDYAGNVEEVSPGVFRSVTRSFDTAAADVSVSGQDDLWHADVPWTLTVSATDPNLPDASGVEAVQYRLDDGPTHDYTGPVTVDPATLDDGTHTFAYGAQDNAGNEQWQSVSLKVDAHAPVSSAPSGYFVDGLYTIAADDQGSGVALTEYRLDGGDWQQYLAPFMLAGASGTQFTIDFRSTDVAGNQEADQAAYVTIDNDAPVSSASGCDDAWHATAVTVGLSAVDAVSGVDHIDYLVTQDETVPGPDAAWTEGESVQVAEQGVNRVWMRAVDKALPNGNAETPHEVTVRIDGLAPSLAITGAETLWHRSAVRLTFTATATPSGVDRIEYVLNGGAPVPLDGPGPSSIDLTAEGSYAVMATAVSGAGVVSPQATAAVKIDKTGPVTSTKAASGRKGLVIRLRYRAVDTMSPQVKSIRVVIRNSKGKVVRTLRPTAAKNTATWYAIKWRPKYRGTYRYSVYAKDLAGNAQSKRISSRIIVR